MGFERFPGSGSPHRTQEWRNCPKCQGSGRDPLGGGACTNASCRNGKVKR